MASPTPITFNGASGERIVRGRAAATLPAWVPALGTVADISLNTLNDVRGAIPQGEIKNTTQTWTGVAWAPWWGAYGKLVGGGGGHGDGYMNYLFTYDAESRLFAIEKDPAPAFFNANDGGYVADTTTGWMWGDSSGGSLQVGEPFTSHFYAYQIALPPSALAGAPNGWLFTPGRTSMWPGTRDTAQSHKWALGSGVSAKWAAHGTPLLRSPAHGPSVYDSKRNRVLHFGEAQASAQQTFPYLDIATQATGTITTDYLYGYYAIGGYHVASDCYMTIRFAAGALVFNVVDATTLAMTSPIASGTPPVETDEGAWDWVESWNAWVYYPGLGGNNIYTLKCVGDPRGNNWVWGKQTVSGPARSVVLGQGGGLPYNRLRYSAPLGIVIWFPDYLLPVQGFNISAP